MMFDSIPTYSRYRTLGLQAPLLVGEDVYALQTALEEVGFPVGQHDGVLGSRTSQAIKEFQRRYSLVSDGLAGGNTQKALAMELARRVAEATGVPLTAFKGQLEHESGYRLGNYSPPRPDGHYDAGVAQRNTKYTDPEKGFDCEDSIKVLGSEINKHYKLFAGLPSRRRWALAQGAWNAPAFACYIARQEGATKVTAGMTAKPSDAARQTFETYVANVSTYL